MATAVVPILGLAGLAILVIRRPAFGMACVGTFLVGVYVWANYLRLPHYLLVPFLLLGSAPRWRWKEPHARPKRACTVEPAGPRVPRWRSSRWRWR